MSISTRSLCIAILAIWLFAVSISAQKSLVPLMLDMPAPPEPVLNQNPKIDSEDFYSYKNPPDDNAPIETLLDYWGQWNLRSNGFTITPSVQTAERILAEIEKNPEIATDYLNVLTNIPGAGDRIKRLYEDRTQLERIPRYERSTIELWLTGNSDIAIEQLENAASRIRDTREYLTNQNELHALARIDWDRARPIAERLANDSSQPVSQTLGRWVLYRHAVEENNPVEAAGYRRLLMDTVEDKTAKPGNRDLALDALVRVGDFEGRDEWYYSLLEDETLAELIVDGRAFTGLTTMITYSPPEKFVEKMIDLAGSKNKTVRNAAIKNLGLMIGTDARVVLALVPWLSDPEWATEARQERISIVNALGQFRVPESVPGLLSMISEATKLVDTIVEPDDSSDARQVLRAKQETYQIRTYGYNLRVRIVKALGNQGDIRAADTLRRLLPLTRKDDRQALVAAIHASGGYDPEFQVSAFEQLARESIDDAKESVDAREKRLSEFDPKERFKRIPKESLNSNGRLDASPSGMLTIRELTGVSAGRGSGGGYGSGSFEFVEPEPFEPSEVIPLLAKSVVAEKEPSAPFISALARRIQNLRKNDKYAAAALREIMFSWDGKPLNALFLSDLRTGNADIGLVVTLLTRRDEIKKEQIEDLIEAAGTNIPEARSIANCILGDEGAALNTMRGSDANAKSALFACARLIRWKLPVSEVSKSIAESDPMLVLSASRYLESAGTEEARNVLWESAPGEAWIIGPQEYYGTAENMPVEGRLTSSLFESVGHARGTYQPWSFYGFSGGAVGEGGEFLESRIRRELLSNDKILGIYWFGGAYVKVFENYAELMWEDDPARYHSRRLSNDELKGFISIIRSSEINDLDAYITACGECAGKTLIMAGRAGGRRIYVSSDNPPSFVGEIESLLKEFKSKPSELRYWAESKVEGLLVVYADDKLEAIRVHKSGDDKLVLLKDQKRADEIEKEIEALYEKDLYEDGFEYGEAGQRNAERKANMPLEAYTWHKLEAGKLGDAVAPPPGIDNSFLSDSDDYYRNPMTTDSNDEALLYASDEGLAFALGQQAERFSDGKFYKPVLDKKSLKAVVMQKFENKDDRLMIVDLLTGGLTKVAPPAGFKLVVAGSYLPQIDRFLVYAGNEKANSGYRLKDEVNFLLDAKSRKLEQAEGNLDPLIEAGENELQPAGEGKFWVAVRKENGTSIGIYALRGFVFTEVLFVPWLSFESSEMLVEDSGRSALIVYNGQVVRIALTGKKPETGNQKPAEN